MTYIVSGGALNSTNSTSPRRESQPYLLILFTALSLRCGSNYNDSKTDLTFAGYGSSVVPWLLIYGVS